MSIRKPFYSSQNDLNKIYLEMNLGYNAAGNTIPNTQNPNEISIKTAKNIPMSLKCSLAMRQIENILDKLEEGTFLEVIEAFKAKFSEKNE